MRYFISIIILNIFIALGGQAIVKKEISSRQSKFFIDSIQTELAKKNSWELFWKTFCTAVNSKEKKMIASLTTKDFCDSGAGELEAWLDSEFFFNEKYFNDYKIILKKGATDFKQEGYPYKATGTNQKGDLFFEYRNEKWLFGGVVGD